MNGGERGRIIRDFQALENTVPGLRIKSRDAEVKALLKCLGITSRKIRPIQVWVAGPPGSGKTTVALHVLENLRRPGDVHAVYVNCWESKTLHAVLDRLVRKLRLMGVEKIDTQFKIERLRKHLEGKALIVALDEIDRVPTREREEILYALGNLGNVGLLCVSYSRSAFFELDERVRSRLSPFLVRLEKYSEEHLLEILRERAAHGLHEGACDERVLTRVAERAEGDSRVAVRTLKQAAQLAEVGGHPQIDTGHIERSWAQVIDLRRKYILQRLTKHHLLIYEIVRDKAPVASREARETYLRQCRRKGIRPVARRTFSVYVKRLIQVGLISVNRQPTWGKPRVLKPSHRFHPES